MNDVLFLRGKSFEVVEGFQLFTENFNQLLGGIDLNDGLC